MDDPNGARQNDPLRHAECLSFDETKPFLEHTKGRIACRSDSCPKDSVRGKCRSVALVHNLHSTQRGTHIH
jgi:hypothetical protein